MESERLQREREAASRCSKGKEVGKNTLYQPLFSFIPFHFLSLFCLLVLVLVLVLVLLLDLLFLWVFKAPPVAYKMTQR
jgi:hypothetical protein